jgi:predicted signal transduction protein with EAL and GGDEF domain
LLRAVAHRLRACLREVDTVARLGGDEFAVIQAGVGGPADAATLAQRILDVVSAPYALTHHSVIVGVSIGIALAPGDGLEAERLMQCADVALYRAKGDGRGVYRFFEAEMDVRLQARRSLELDLRAAFEAEAFDLHYQPIYDLAQERICGFEALLRWTHPTRGRVSPAEFVPLAEEIGLIVPLGEWVLRRACREAVGWPEGLKVAVNVSAAQFTSSALIGTVKAALAESGLPARRLELEITESVLLVNGSATVAILHGLRDLGVRIAMDDFGTGYSSLSYLRSFPFDKMKVDQSFTRDLTVEQGSDFIVRAVVSLAASLGMTTTAEGVETPEQLAWLREEGCDEVQGYLFSPPVPASALPALLDLWNGRKRRAA